MKKLWFTVISLALALAVLGVAGCSAGSPTVGTAPANLRVNIGSQQEGIWVTGTGKVSVEPDIANLRLGIEAQNTSVAAAQSQASTAMEAVMDALQDNGVADRDIQTQYFNIQRVTRWDQDKQQEAVIGYRVTNIVTAKVRDIEGIGALIDAVAAAGGDLTRIRDVSFAVEDPEESRDEAREKAVADARAKAEQTAELAGVKLGEPVYITESFYQPTPVYRQSFAETAVPAPAVETPISAGELDVVLTVQIAYTID